MSATDMKTALGQLAMAMGMRALERVTSQFDPDVMMQQATEVVGTELKAAFQEILGDPDNSWTSDLIDRLYEDLDAGDVIEKIAAPLAKAMAEYYQQETTELVDAIVDQLDLDSLAEMVAAKIAARVQIGQ